MVSIKRVAKKVIICSLVGLLQVGLFATAAEAAPPRPFEPPRYEHRHDHERRDFEKEKKRRIQEENKRHEHNMKRLPFESKKKWHERQKKEIERHKRAIHEIMRMKFR